MRTLIAYDNNGVILYQVTAEHKVYEPVGVPFLWVDVPKGKYVSNVDVLGKKHVPVFEDLPKSTEQLMQDRITDIELALAEILLL